MGTNWMIVLSLFVFFATVGVMSSLIAGDMVLSSSNATIESYLDSAYDDAGVLQKPFILVAQNTLSSVDGVGTQFGEANLFTRLVVGFDSLPDWFNLSISVLLAILIITLIVSILPGVGS